MKEEYRQAQLKAQAALEAEREEERRRENERVETLARVIEDGQSVLIDEMVDAIYLHNYLGNSYAAMDEDDLRKHLKGKFQDDDSYLEARAQFISWKNRRAAETFAETTARSRARKRRKWTGRLWGLIAVTAVILFVLANPGY